MKKGNQKTRHPKADGLIGFRNASLPDFERMLHLEFVGVKGDWVQGYRILTKEHLEEVVLDPSGFKPFTWIPHLRVVSCFSKLRAIWRRTARLIWYK